MRNALGSLVFAIVGVQEFELLLTGVFSYTFKLWFNNRRLPGSADERLEAGGVARTVEALA